MINQLLDEPYWNELEMRIEALHSGREKRHNVLYAATSFMRLYFENYTVKEIVEKLESQMPALKSFLIKNMDQFEVYNTYPSSERSDASDMVARKIHELKSELKNSNNLEILFKIDQYESVCFDKFHSLRVDANAEEDGFINYNNSFIKPLTELYYNILSLKKSI